MQKSNKIRWRSSDEKRIEKLVKNFNQKLKRIEKRNPDLKQYLPEKLSKKELKSKFDNRKDFNREIKSLERFLRKDSEKTITSKSGLTLTKWEYHEMALKVASINRKRTLERKILEQIPTTSQGKPTGLKRGEMGSERLNDLAPKKFDIDKIQRGKAWELFKNSVEKQVRESYFEERYDQYKENYIKGLQNEFGSRADEIIEIIRKMDSKTFTMKYYEEQEASIKFIYDLAEAQVRLELITDIWKNAANL